MDAYQHPGRGNPKLDACEIAGFGELVHNYLKQQEVFCKH